MKDHEMLALRRIVAKVEVVMKEVLRFVCSAKPCVILAEEADETLTTGPVDTIMIFCRVIRPVITHSTPRFSLLSFEDLFSSTGLHTFARIFAFHFVSNSVTMMDDGIHDYSRHVMRRDAMF
jgi:hypothetical protein